MNRLLRIGLIAEGEAELGTSVPFIHNPKQGGTLIEQMQEGALHTLIRRELRAAGLPECVFVHRHRTSKDNLWRYRMGDSVIEPKYLAQTIVSWKPAEVDMIVVVIDEDDKAVARKRQLKRASQIIIENHLDDNGELLQDRHCLGLAIKSFDTWLLADVERVVQLLAVTLPTELPDALESLPGSSASSQHAKKILDQAIDASQYAPTAHRVQSRNLEARWDLAKIIDLNEVKRRCVRGYESFSKVLLITTQTTLSVLQGPKTPTDMPK